MIRNLPIPPIPENFDETVLLRAWMVELPQATSPDDFDARVLTKLRKPQFWTLNGIVLALALGLGLWMGAHPYPVTIVHVPDVRAVSTDLLNLPPAPAKEDVRFRTPSPVTKSTKAPFGRAGN